MDRIHPRAASHNRGRSNRAGILALFEQQASVNGDEVLNQINRGIAAATWSFTSTVSQAVGKLMGTPVATSTSQPIEPCTTDPFALVLGLHSSGSSAMAGVVHHLGVHLGTNMGGFYGNDPEKSCGFEELELVRLCEEIIPFPSLSVRYSNAPLHNAYAPGCGAQGENSAGKYHIIAPFREIVGPH